MVVAIFIDLRKAFDTVSHKTILDKLDYLGIRGTELNWFNLYLNKRSQYVEIGRSHSERIPLSVGVTQGSLLPVLLFQLIINDLFKSVRYSTSILYADDTTLLLSDSSLRFIKCKIQADMNSLSHWLKSNKLKLNVSKTKCMLFHKEGLSPKVEIFVDNQCIEMVQQFKFLGLTIDHTLMFVQHGQELHSKLLKSTFIIRSLSRFLPKFCLRELYFAYFQSHLMYCIIIWYPLLNRPTQLTLFRLQKRVLRSVCGAPFHAHCMPLFKRERIPIMEDQVFIENCKLMYRVANGHC